MNTLRRSIGVEVELAEWGTLRAGGATAVKRDNPLLVCQFERDGSVQPSGMELVVGPQAGDNYLTVMSKLISRLKESGVEANNTCGYHAHIDAASMTLPELRRVILGFAYMQNSIFHYLVAPHRLQEPAYHYTQKISGLQGLRECKSSSEISAWLDMWLYGVHIHPLMGGEERRQLKRRLETLKSHKYENAARRRALNLHSWMMRGTIEFRLKEGTTDPTELLMWPLWCGWFVEHCAGATDAAIDKWRESSPGLDVIAKRWPEAVRNYIKAHLGGAPELKAAEPPNLEDVAVRRWQDRMAAQGPWPQDQELAAAQHAALQRELARIRRAL